MPFLSPFRFFLLGLFTLAISHHAAAAPSAEALKFFENKVRPILVESCQECHAEKKHKGDLRLDNLPFILHGGASGPAIVPHQPDKSLLIKAVSYVDPDMEMPPDGKLPDGQVAILKQWILMGAPWPEAEVVAAKSVRIPGQITDEDRQWWSFQPVKSPPLPKVAAPTPIDAFIRAKLTETGLAPSPEASPQDLIRRLYFDLIGLPPSISEIDPFN
ncbi:MAG: c-type cytochrome domain-containing protein, partial [Prosthecobacter sp.]|nr:c-type cytochrome domain-containing protein [Prosthecobacter sp.]